MPYPGTAYMNREDMPDMEEDERILRSIMLSQAHDDACWPRPSMPSIYLRPRPPISYHGWLREEQKDRKLRTIHAELVQYLTDQMTSDMVKELKDNLLLREVISPSIHDELGGVHKIIDELQRRNQIVKGKKDGYKLLIEILKDMKQYRLTETVEKCQNELWNICNDDSATSEQPATKGSRDSPEASDKNMIKELRMKLDSKNKSSERFEKENGFLRSELSSLKTQMKMKSEAFKTEVQRLKDENEALKKLSVDQNVLKEVNQLQQQFTEMKSTLSEIQRDVKSEKYKDDIEKAGQAANENVAQMERELNDLKTKLQMAKDENENLKAGNQREVQAQLDETKTEIKQLRQLLNENMAIIKEHKLEQENIPPWVQILLKGKEKEIEELEEEVQKMLEEKQRRTYAKIANLIDSEMDKEKRTAMKHHLHVSGHITTKEFDTLNDVYDIIKCLQSKDIINIGKEGGYDELLKILRDKDHHALANEVEECLRMFWKDVKDLSSRGAKPLITEQPGADETLEPQEAVDKDGSDSHLGDEDQTGLCSNFFDGTVADAQEEH